MNTNNLKNNSDVISHLMGNPQNNQISNPNGCPIGSGMTRKKDSPRMTGLALSLIFAITLGVSTSTMAYTSCVGGTEITANAHTDADAPDTCTADYCPSPAKSFCISTNPMNWWSAFNWCKSNGGTLASFNSACPNTPVRTNNTAGACPALQGVGESKYYWTSMGSGSSYAFNVNLSSGAVSASYRSSSGDFALCE